MTPVTDLGERSSLGVRELRSTFQVGLQDAIFGGQIFVPRQSVNSASKKPVEESACVIVSSEGIDKMTASLLLSENTLYGERPHY
jgi:hypothetical protein